MADEVFYIKQGDTSPALRYELLPRSVNLTGAGYVVFNLWDRNKTVIVNRSAAVVVTASGTPTVEYRWSLGDTDEVGLFQGEFEVQFADGKKGTFPNDGYIAVKITDDIA